jgi:iron complex outermembrane receptor protein
VNTNSPFERNSDLIPNNERTTLYLEGAFDVGGGIEAYGELLMNRRETSTNGFRQVWTYLYSYNYSCRFTQYAETGAICYEGGDPFSAGWQGLAGLSPTVTTDHADSQQTVDYARVVAGLRGEFQGWLGPLNWDFYYQGSRSDGSYTDDRLLADAVYSSEGRSDSLRGPGAADDGTLARGIIAPNSIPRPTASCVGYVTPISNRACIDVDWMSAALNNGQGFTAAEEAFLYDRETGETEYTQHYYEASITGDIFTLPAGNVGAAFGIVHREDEILDTPGELTLAGNAWNSSASGITRGSDTTQEVFGELAIPILRGSSFAESLEATISGRYTDVESSGTASTYKVGLAWQITSEWLLRATQGTSFRAPALFELYLAGESSFPSQRAIDPCIGWGQALTDGDIPQRVADNCAADGIPDDYTGAGASATSFRSGGAGLLEPETSEARVLGIVWTPRFADLQVALDYFEIEVEDEVATLGAAQIVYGCYNSASFPTDPLCTLFTRSPINLIDEVYNSFLNINSQVNRGIDLTVRYGHDFSFGNFTTQAQFTYQLEDETSLFSGTTTDPNGSSGDPMFVGSIDFSLERGDWTAFWRAQLIGETDDSNFSSGGTLLTRYDIEGEFTTYHSASLSREFDNFSLLLGVANIFDQEPPSVTTLGAATQSAVGPSLLASQYDYIGRRAFLRVTADF